MLPSVYTTEISQEHSEAGECRENVFDCTMKMKTDASAVHTGSLSELLTAAALLTEHY